MEIKQIKEFLISWKDGVIEIGKVYLDGGEYELVANKFLEKHYAFYEVDILFKPTFTKETIFRNNKKAGLSYFIGGDLSEDSGFALKPWESIELNELNTLIEKDLIAAMGTLQFKPHKKEETILVAFTFIFTKIGDTLKIKVHHSSPVT